MARVCEIEGCKNKAAWNAESDWAVAPERPAKRVRLCEQHALELMALGAAKTEVKL